MAERALKPWQWNDFIFYTFFANGRQFYSSLKTLHEFTSQVSAHFAIVSNTTLSQVIAERRNAFHPLEENTEGRRLAFLDLLLDMESKQQISSTDVKEQTDTFMFEVELIIHKRYVYICRDTIQHPME